MMPTCPVCSKPAPAAHAPFCGERCRTVDLNRWFTGAYAVPAIELDDVDEDALSAAENLPKDDGF